MIDSSADDWSFATAREPARFGAGERDDVPGVEHAMTAGGTLCGLPEDQVTRYRHLFAPRDPLACPQCRRQAAAAPAEPSAQERLHDLVLAAAPGTARDDLLAGLAKGAKVGLWLHGPSAALARHYAELDTLTEGVGPVAEAFDAATTIGLARVEDGSWRFLVVLPDDGGRPLVARGRHETG
ncbi:hypothetical protein ACIHEJ_38390 [Streptomyces sp. NPDC052301]|uniref:hypothetical protein n=1 Tax=Streptomyces sp. NPDC052301 TaxID=3365687 RepID=UPI0037D0FD29